VAHLQGKDLLKMFSKTKDTLVDTRAVKIEFQHGIATSKYKWMSLSWEQRRTNTLRGRLARSLLLRKDDEEQEQQGQAQLQGQDQPQAQADPEDI